MQLSEYEQNSLHKLGESIHQGKWTKEGLVHLIELTGEYLNLETIPGYAYKNDLTYNGVKKTRDIREIFGVKFVVDNS